MEALSVQMYTVGKSQIFHLTIKLSHFLVDIAVRLPDLAKSYLQTPLVQVPEIGEPSTSVERMNTAQLPKLRL